MSRTTDKEPDKEPDPESFEASESERPFRRWSRRKHAARVAAKREPVIADSNEASNVAVPQRNLTDADMPAIESLNEQSDYSPFMSPGVSDTLRQAALRRLFQAPKFNELCELEGEFFDARGYRPLGNIVTYDMRAALKRELEQAKTSTKKKIRDELTNPEESESAADVSVTGPESPDREDADAEAVATRIDENLPNNRGAT